MRTGSGKALSCDFVVALPFTSRDAFPLAPSGGGVVADNRAVRGKNHLGVGAGIGKLNLVDDPVVPLCFIDAGDLRPWRLGFYRLLHGGREFIELGRRVCDLLGAADDQRSCEYC